MTSTVRTDTSPVTENRVQLLHPLRNVLLGMLTRPSAVIVDGNKTKDISHVEAGLKGYVFDPFHSPYLIPSY